MKKFFLVAAMAAFVLTSVNAQNKYKPEAMTISTELSYSPGGATDGGFSLPEYGAKVRLHLNENMAVRLNLGLNTSSSKTTTFVPDGNEETEEYSRTSLTTFSFMPGFEYHFAKYERISPYVGGEIGLLTSTAKTKSDKSETEDRTTESKTPGIGFGVNVFSGVDVYLCKGLYLGFELGLGYESLNTQRGSTTTVTGNTTNETKGTQSTLVSSFGFHATPSLRVGWCF